MTGRLPDGYRERALAWLAGGMRAVQPRDAATVALLRDGADGLEIYLLRRVSSMAFAAGMFVFPGGAVDLRDVTHDVPWRGPDPAVWAQRFGADSSLTRGLVCAAVRETFEECGVLLAESDGEIVKDTRGDDWETDRLALIDRKLALRDLLATRRLVLRADLLRPWAHWITPEFEARRYNTRFFVAAVPAGQQPRDVGGEANLVAWMRPADALDGFDAGRLAMLPPTVAVLRELCPFRELAAVLAAAETRRIAPIMPRPVLTDGELRLEIAEHPS